MMNVRLRLKKIVKPKQVRMKFDLEKLKDPKIAEAFQAMIGGKCALLTILEEENTDIETLANKFNSALTDTASVILGKHRHKKKPWVTIELLDMCDKRRVLKRGRTAPEELINIGKSTKKSEQARKKPRKMDRRTVQRNRRQPEQELAKEHSKS